MGIVSQLIKDGVLGGEVVTQVIELTSEHIASLKIKKTVVVETDNSLFLIKIKDEFLGNKTWNASELLIKEVSK